MTSKQNRPATAQELAEMHAISDELERLVTGHDMRCVIFVLSHALALYWCMGRQFDSATDALDLWRSSLNQEMEGIIRKHFGQIRYWDADAEQR
jgi:hypothetical protein